MASGMLPERKVPRVADVSGAVEKLILEFLF